MPRDGSGNFSLPANTLAVSGDPISSTKFNTLVQDIEADANVDRPVVAGGTGASTAANARTNLGLAIGTDVQAFDAGLLSIAGLTTLADRSIYTTASDTYAVYTLTAAGRAILDDADASAQRTTLGLGTAAIVNTGTSGATIPLLNGANTWSAAQTLSGAGLKWATISTTSADPGYHMTNNSARLDRILNTSNGLYIGVDALGTERTLTLSTAGVLETGGNIVWHAGNDGAGSGLDADTLDGVQGSAFATLAGANTFTARQIIDRSAAAGAGNLTIRGGGAGFVRSALTLETGDTVRGAGVYIWEDTSDVEFFFGLRFNHVSADGLSILRRASVTSGSTDSATADPSVATELVRFSTTGMRGRVMPSTEVSGTLTVVSANTTIQATGDITINNSVFAAGDIIMIYAGASARTLTQGSGVTMRLGGSATTGSRTLAARGVAMLFFVSASEVVVSGGAVT